MGVRNCAELGENLQKIVKRLMANDNLVKLLYYSDEDPLSHDNLTDLEKNSKIFGKLIKVIPVVKNEENKSVVTVSITDGAINSSNDEFRDVEFSVEVFVPLNNWFISDTNLRPFAILGEVQKSLQNKQVNGLGKIKGGDFSLEFLTEEVVAYSMHFMVTSYD